MTAVAGRWQLERRLDAGGENEVWLARDTIVGGTFALKLGGAPPPAWPEHPSLVRVVASGIDGGRAYVVMALVAGRTLGAVLAEGPLGPGEARRIFDSIEAAVGALAAAGVSHGDVRPQNVMLGPDGAVTLIDPEDPRLIRATDDRAALADLARRLGMG